MSTMFNLAAVAVYALVFVFKPALGVQRLRNEQQSQLAAGSCYAVVWPAEYSYKEGCKKFDTGTHQCKCTHQNCKFDTLAACCGHKTGLKGCESKVEDTPADNSPSEEDSSVPSSCYRTTWETGKGSVCRVSTSCDCSAETCRFASKKDCCNFHEAWLNKTDCFADAPVTHPKGDVTKDDTCPWKWILKEKTCSKNFKACLSSLPSASTMACTNEKLKEHAFMCLKSRAAGSNTAKWCQNEFPTEVLYCDGVKCGIPESEDYKCTILPSGKGKTTLQCPDPVVVTGNFKAVNSATDLSMATMDTTIDIEK